MSDEPSFPNLPIVEVERGVVDTNGFRVEALEKLRAAVSSREDELVHVHGMGESAARSLEVAYASRLRRARMSALSLAVPGVGFAILSAAALCIPFLSIDLAPAMRGLAAVMAYPCLLVALNLLYPAHARHAGVDRLHGHKAWLIAGARQRAQSLLGIGRKFLYIVSPATFSATVSIEPMETLSRIDVEELDGEAAQLVVVRRAGDVARIFAGMDRTTAKKAASDFDAVAGSTVGVDLVKHAIPEVILA